jgi:hypothetical protein
MTIKRFQLLRDQIVVWRFHFWALQPNGLEILKTELWKLSFERILDSLRNLHPSISQINALEKTVQDLKESWEKRHKVKITPKKAILL